MRRAAEIGIWYAIRDPVMRDPAILWRLRSVRRRSASQTARVRAKKENLMADFSCVSTKRLSDGSSPMSWKAPMRFRVILAVAAFALAGCNARTKPLAR